jgi:D-serine deaminase-like pyridoxal phosphate-dependent protein
VRRDLHTAETDERMVLERLSEEHATVRAAGGDPALLPTGTLVRIVPNHSCVVSNLVDAIWMVDGERVVERLPVAARGRIT